uniref:Plastid light harvesting protein n=1 Tax=Pseudo-nitzschia australis TaxID=44445 RepID=A0A7S4ABF7_9STRA|mmetsp:Transcript_8665/g.18712  ORF Transcript_8665/g.18712 Transcript_8665/m.18712 type:complete len:228 (-) Transcript_8665:50-733(-)
MKFTCALLLAGSATAFTSINKSTQRTQTVQLSEKKDGDMSQALPFAQRPKILDGTMAGDVGFDPFGLAGDDKAKLMYMREAEIKHSRLAMLAAAGWPISELWDKQIADAVGLPSLLTNAGDAPSLLNGGLDKISAAYWVAIVSLAGIIELENMKMKEEKGKAYIAGDCNFDPLNLLPQDKEGQMQMMTKEIKHGRIAMMAILGFAIQEALYRTPVVAETPFFFHPLF